MSAPLTSVYPRKRPIPVRRRAAALLRDLILVTAAVLFALPVVVLLLATTKTQNQITNGSVFAIGNPANIATAWRHLYQFNDGVIVHWIINSLLYSVMSVSAMLVLCIPAGYGLAKFSFLGQRTILTATLLAMIVPTAATILPLYVEMSTVHLTGTLWSVVLPLAFYPWGVYLAYTFFASTLPDSLIEAGRVDGASELRVFLQIALPLARPLIALITFFGFVTAWTNFMLPYLMLSDPKTYPLPLGITVLPLADAVSGNPNLSNVDVQLPEVALIGVISVLPILLMFLFAQRHLASAQLTGADKG